ncbi:M48 family metallopeptidase [Phormidesmis sp. 146-35]
MLNPSSQPSFSALWRKTRRWFYPVLSVTIALGIAIGQPMMAQASWLDLLRGGVQVIQGIQITRMSDAQETELGQQINREITTKQVRLIRDARINDYVNQIGQRLAAKSERPNLRYTFQVVDDNAINAFATMGGFVYVHKGLLTAADNEAQLASVMGHEIGHITARHAIKQMGETMRTRGLLTATGADRSQAINIGVQLAMRLPHSRRAEFEADQVGLNMLTRAGYAPSEMVAFMQKLVSARSTPTFLSTHPAAADRVVRLKQMVQSGSAGGKDGLNSAEYKSRIQALR